MRLFASWSRRLDRDPPRGEGGGHRACSWARVGGMDAEAVSSRATLPGMSIAAPCSKCTPSVPSAPEAASRWDSPERSHAASYSRRSGLHQLHSSFRHSLIACSRCWAGDRSTTFASSLYYRLIADWTGAGDTVTLLLPIRMLWGALPRRAAPSGRIAGRPSPRRLLSSRFGRVPSRATPKFSADRVDQPPRQEPAFCSITPRIR